MVDRLLRDGYPTDLGAPICPMGQRVSGGMGWSHAGMSKLILGCDLSRSAYCAGSHVPEVAGGMGPQALCHGGRFTATKKLREKQLLWVNDGSRKRQATSCRRGDKKRSGFRQGKTQGAATICPLSLIAMRNMFLMRWRLGVPQPSLGVSSLDLGRGHCFRPFLLLLTL